MARVLGRRHNPTDVTNVDIMFFVYHLSLRTHVEISSVVRRVCTQVTVVGPHPIVVQGQGFEYGTARSLFSVRKHTGCPSLALWLWNSGCLSWAVLNITSARCDLFNRVCFRWWSEDCTVRDASGKQRRLYSGVCSGFIFCVFIFFVLFLVC